MGVTLHPLRPEPFASHVDVLTAAQYIERAIHARTAHAAAYWLRRARAQVLHARDYWRTAGQPTLAAWSDEVAARLGGLAATASGLRPAGLAGWQSGVLYPFQGYMATLDRAGRW